VNPFAAPALLWLALAAPAAAVAALWLWRRRLRAEAAWAAPGLWERLAAGHRPGRRGAAVALLALAVLGAAVALARPRWGSETETVERRGVDLVFVLDSSLSMAARDVTPSRLWVAKALVRRLAQAMPGNRVALVQAEGEGLVLTPLTVDAAVLDLLLDAVEPGSLPVPGTELATALDTARGLFEPSGVGGGGHRVIVVVSDGEDHGGGLEKIAGRLREEGVVVNAVGVGTPAGAPLPLSSAPGSAGAGEVKRDENGAPVISRLDEASLEGVARETGGVYLRATSGAVDLAPLVRRIGAMHQRAFETETLNTREERFQWPLALAALALLLHLAVGAFRPVSKVGAGGEAAR
jgi:Ca-activated chloride channel homolog